MGSAVIIRDFHAYKLQPDAPMQRIKYSSLQFLSFVLDCICLYLYKYDMILVEFPNIKFLWYQLIEKTSFPTISRDAPVLETTNFLWRL